jgi:hypothetical protein
MSATASRFVRECAVRSRQLPACVQCVFATCSVVRRRCCRNAPAHMHELHSTVQTSCGQRAAFAAPLLPLGRRGALCAWLATGRSRERMREAETEGQIKGVARRAPPSQPARGVAAAPQGFLRVPRRAWNPHGSGVCRVPFAIRCAAVRWSLHGWQ